MCWKGGSFLEAQGGSTSHGSYSENLEWSRSAGERGGEWKAIQWPEQLGLAGTWALLKAFCPGSVLN